MTTYLAAASVPILIILLLLLFVIGRWVRTGSGSGPKLIFYLYTPKRQGPLEPNPERTQRARRRGQRRVTKMAAVAKAHHKRTCCDVATESKDRHAMERERPVASWHPGSTGPAHVRHTRTCTADPPPGLSTNGGPCVLEAAR